MHPVTKRRHRRTMPAAAVLGIALTTSCATLQAPSRMPDLRPDEVRSASTGGVDLRAMPIEGRDAYWDLFDDDLPEIGVVAVWVELRNGSDTAVDLGKVKWILKSNGQTIDSLDVSDVYDRYYKGRHIRMYSEHSDWQAQRKMESEVFQSGRIPPRLKRAGLLFFGIEPNRAGDWDHDLSLRAENIGIDARESISMEVPISHAQP